MTLAEQLAELRENILRDTSDIIRGNKDSMWTDDTLLRYIGDAERRFARQTFCIRDGTSPEFTQVILQENVVTYPLPKQVMGILSAKFDTHHHDLLHSGHGMLFGSPPIDANRLVFNPLHPYTQPPGEPAAYYSDESMVYDNRQRIALSVYPAPSAEVAGKKIYMRVLREPTSKYNQNCLDNESEIPEVYQLDVLEWAAYRAQRTFDADAGAQTTAEDHKTAFEAAEQRAIRELKQRMFSRIGFSYGMYGFSWGR